MNPAGGRRARAVVVFLLLSLGCGGANRWEIRHLDAPGDCVVVFGDSLAAGYGIDPARAFPALLARELGLPVVVEARVGDTTQDGLARFDAALAPHRPFIVGI